MPATKTIASGAASPGYWAQACKQLMKKDRVMKRLIPQFADATLQTRGDAFVTLRLVLPDTADADLQAFAEGWAAGRAQNPRAGMES